MNQIKGTDALDVLKHRYGGDPDFEEGVALAREQLAAAPLVYDARNQAGLSQSQLAERIGEEQSVVVKLEEADYEGQLLPLLRKIDHALNLGLELKFVSAQKEINALNRDS